MPILEMYKRHLERLRREDGRGDFRGPGRAGPPLGRRHLEDDRSRPSGGDSYRRRDQPLFPRHAPQPRQLSAADAHRQHWQARRRRASPGPATTKGRCCRHRRGAARAWRATPHEDPFAPVLDETARITHANLRHCSDGEDPSYWACGERTLTVNLPKGRSADFTGKLPPADAHQSHLVQQRQFPQPVEVGLQPDRQRAAQGRHDRRSADRMDRQRRVFRRRAAGQLVGGNRGLRMRRLVLESVSAGLERGHQAGPRYDRRCGGLRRRGPTP